MTHELFEAHAKSKPNTENESVRNKNNRSSLAYGGFNASVAEVIDHSDSGWSCSSAVGNLLSWPTEQRENKQFSGLSLSPFSRYHCYYCYYCYYFKTGRYYQGRKLEQKKWEGQFLPSLSPPISFPSLPLLPLSSPFPPLRNRPHIAATAG